MDEIEPDSKSIEAVIAERPDIRKIFRRSSNYLILIGIVNLVDGLSAVLVTRIEPFGVHVLASLGFGTIFLATGVMVRSASLHAYRVALGLFAVESTWGLINSVRYYGLGILSFGNLLFILLGWVILYGGYQTIQSSLRKDESLQPEEKDYTVTRLVLVLAILLVILGFCSLPLIFGRG